MDNYKPPFNRTDEMLEYVSEIMETIGQLSGVNGLEKLPRLRKANRIKSIHSSLAIENNTLSLEQVKDIIEGKIVLGPINEIQEVKNTFEAYKEIGNINPYDIRDLLKIHKIMMSGLINCSGNFRESSVGVFNNKKVIHVAPPYERVRGLMEDLLNWVKDSRAHPLIKSSIFHYEFEFIHPFTDGNGRMGRLWQTALLSKWKPIFEWIPIESIIKDRQDEYYKAIALSTSQGKSDIFVIFMLKSILDSVDRIKVDSRKHINHISDRVRQLYEVLEDYPMSSNEIMKLLNLKSRESFRQNYLIPALEANIIHMTIPERPTSKNQRYYRK